MESRLLYRRNFRGGRKSPGLSLFDNLTARAVRLGSDLTLAFPDNVDVRLCGLGELIAADLADGETPSEWIRDAVAKKLGVDAPVVELGQRNFGEQGAAGAAARWGKKRKKKPVAKRRAID